MGNAVPRGKPSRLIGDFARYLTSPGYCAFLIPPFHWFCRCFYPWVSGRNIPQNHRLSVVISCLPESSTCSQLWWSRPSPSLGPVATRWLVALGLLLAGGRWKLKVHPGWRCLISALKGPGTLLALLICLIRDNLLNVGLRNVGKSIYYAVIECVSQGRLILAMNPVSTPAPTRHQSRFPAGNNLR